MFSKKRISLLLILMVCFIDIAGVGLVYPMFASMLFQPDGQLLSPDTSDAVRGACLGILLAAMPLTQFFSSPILGMLSDQKGRKKILIPSLALGVLGYLIAMFAVYWGSYILLLFSRIGIGISAGTAAVVSASMADISLPEEKSKNFALMNMVFGLGFTVGPFFGGLLSELKMGFIEGYALPFAAAGVVTLINLLFTILFFEETFTPKTVEPLSFTIGLKNIKKAFQIENLRVVFFVIFLTCTGWSFYWEFAPVTWISTYGFTAGTIGNFYAYGAIVYALSCGLLIRPIVDRFSNQLVMRYSLMLCGASIAALLLHDNELWLWLYIPVQQFAMALFFPTASALVSNSVSQDVQGETLGVLQSMDALAFAVSPLIAGPLLGISALMPIAVGSSVILLSGGIFILYLKNAEEANKRRA